MSETQTVARSRAERRARIPAPSVREQQFASLAAHLIASGLQPEPGETLTTFGRRVRRIAARIQHERRRARRKAARASRKGNR